MLPVLKFLKWMKKKRTSSSPPVSLSEMSLDEAEDKIRSVSEAYDKVWYDKSGGDPEKGENPAQLRQKNGSGKTL